MDAPPEKKGRMGDTPEEQESTTISMVVEEWAVGQMEQFSPVHRIKGFNFRFHIQRISGGSVSLICDKSSEAELWKCAATIQWRGCVSKQSKKYVFCSWNSDELSPPVQQPGLLGEDGSVQVTIVIESSWISPHLRPSLDSTIPKDAILVIGDEKKEIKVHKEFLASLSPFFDRLLLGNVNEINMGTITIEDVEFNEFNNIMKIVYGSSDAKLTDESVHRVLDLADRFELKIVEDKVVSYLLTAESPIPSRFYLRGNFLSSHSNFSRARKLLISQQRNIPVLKDLCLSECKRGLDILDIKEKREYANFSDVLKVEILDREIEIGREYEEKYGRIAVSSREERENGDTPEKTESTTISMVVQEWEEGQEHLFSPVYRINGFPFRLRMDRDYWGSRGPYIECVKSNEAELWKCTATVAKHLNRPRGYWQGELVFCSWSYLGIDGSTTMTYAVGTTVLVTIAVKEGPNSWSSPSLRPPLESIKPADGILVIGEEKNEIRVNKEFLSAQSPFFDRLFFGENMDKISIGDVGYEEFYRIMKMLYGTFPRSNWLLVQSSMTRKNVLRVLELAHRFELKIVKDLVTTYLLFDNSLSLFSFSLAQKLLVSEKKNIPLLKKLCLEEDIGKDEFIHVHKSPQYGKFSDELKAYILERMQN